MHIAYSFRNIHAITEPSSQLRRCAITLVTTMATMQIVPSQNQDEPVTQVDVQAPGLRRRLAGMSPPPPKDGGHTRVRQRQLIRTTLAFKRGREVLGKRQGA
eukprot:6213165-Pleurochrysis_carterae.AAC.1